ncbi:MAG: LysR family transcriptional regulator [Betaproteobacteria bacterium]
MNQPQPRSLDLNLLRTFQAVYIAGNVRRAAEKLGLSQPAVSHGLTRLRLRLKDPLFIRSPGGVTPTPRAHDFARAVDVALATVDAALGGSLSFDPATSERRFALHMSDLGQGEFLPVLMAHLRDHAPAVRIDVRQLPLEDVQPALDQRRIDLALGHLPEIHGTMHEQLIVDRYVLLVRRGHPLAGSLASAATRRRLEYIVALSHPEPEKALHRLGLGDQIRLMLPHYSAAADVVAHTDLATVIPRRPALRYARHFDLRVGEWPGDLPRLGIWAHWSWRMESDPGHRWLRETLAELYRAEGPAVR